MSKFISLIPRFSCAFSEINFSSITPTTCSQTSLTFMFLPMALSPVNNFFSIFLPIIQTGKAFSLCAFVKFLQLQNINVIVAANLTSRKYQNWAKKNFANYLSIHIDAKLQNLKKRDKKNIYNKKKDVVGVNIKNHKPKNSDLYLENNNSKKKFLENIKLINNKIKAKKMTFN